MAIWKEGKYLGWYAELGNGLNLSVFYNPKKLDPDRPYEAQVFGYHTIRAATREEAQQAAEGIARKALSQALAALDAKDDGKDGETMSNDTTQHTPDDVRERVKEPTQAQIDDACMWYRHDFGLLSEKERDSVRFEARQWFRAWGKALSNGDDYAALLRTPRGEGEDTIPVSALRSEIAQLRAHRLLPYLAWARLCALAGGEPVGEDTPAALRSEAQGEAEALDALREIGAPIE